MNDVEACDLARNFSGIARREFLDIGALPVSVLLHERATFGRCRRPAQPALRTEKCLLLMPTDRPNELHQNGSAIETP